MNNRIVTRFPASWRTSFTILRGGGRDKFTNPLPESEIEVPHGLIAPRVSTEQDDFSDLADATAVLYCDLTPGLSFSNTDRIRIPEGSRLAGIWSIVGRPGEWPFGWEVGLKK